MTLKVLSFLFVIYLSLFHHIAIAEIKADHEAGMYSSLTKPPETIIVGITIDWGAYKDGDGVLSSTQCQEGKYKILRKEIVPFNDYIKRVLFWEWGPVRQWEPESLKAAAMAVKSFAWYKMFLGQRHKQGIDILDNTCDQFFVSMNVKEDTLLSEYKIIDQATVKNMKNAVTSTRKYIMKRKTLRHEHVFNVEFRDSKDTCESNSTEGQCLPQKEAHEFAAKTGKKWQDILENYYTSIDIHQWKKLEVGDQVKSISALTVREDAASNESNPDIQDADKTGVVKDIVYQKSNGSYGYDWFKIDWADKKIGWSADGHLKPIITGTTPDTDNDDNSSDQQNTTVQKGAIVRHIDGYNIRDNPNTSPSSTVINKNWNIEEGVILDGGEKADGYTWWLIFWDNGETGWSAERAFKITGKHETSGRLRHACETYFYKKIIAKPNNYSSSGDFFISYLFFEEPMKTNCDFGLGVSFLFGDEDDEQIHRSRRSHRSHYNNPAHFPVTRSQYVKLVSEALEVDNSDKPFRTPTEQPFNDVLVEDQFAPYIQYAKDKGIIHGCGEGHFCPDEYITKAEGIKIVIAGFKDKFAKIFNAFSNGKEPVRLFNDVTDKSAWFYPYVYTAKESHLLHGYKDNSFKPNELMSRANMAKVVCIAAFGPMECSNIGDTDRSFVFAVTPDTATVNEPVTFTIEGLSMPIPVTLALPDCANLTPVSSGTAEKQDFQCTPTLAGLKNATVNAPDGTVLVEFAVEVKDISTPPPPPSCTPSVTAVSPLTAVLNQTQVFTVKGLCLPETTVFSIAECDDLARLDGDEQQQPFRCVPNSTGDKPGVVKDEPEGTVLHDFTVSVTEDSSTTTPTPLEGDGLIHDKYKPGDATKLFILNEKMTTTCTFSDVDQSSVFAEAVNALCRAGILVGYWENDKRVFIKLDPDNPNISRNDSANKMTKAILAEILKVFLFAVDYDYFGVRHVNDSDWYKLFMDEATNRGLDLYDLAYNNHVTRGQAMTWLAQLFYDYTGSDPIALLDSKDITNGERPNDALTRYELALLTYRAILDTDKTDEIHFALFDAPAPKLPSSNFGQSVANQALAAVGQTYPYVDSQYTYSARFVRTQFEKQAHWPDAKSLCQHYDELGVMATSETPPAGAVICYLPAETNWDYGHVAIAIGDGTEAGVTSLSDGVTQRDIYLGTGYQGWIDAQDFENHYP